MERASHEHSVRFQHLHAERADVVKRFYDKLVHLDDHLSATLRFLQLEGDDLEAKVRHLGSLFNDLRQYFLPNRIFLEEDLCVLIDKILDSVKGIFYDLTVHPVNPLDANYQIDRALLQERHAFWEKARAIHKNEITELKKKLEYEFRKLLGIAG